MNNTATHPPSAEAPTKIANKNNPLETAVFLIIFSGFFFGIANVMGFANMLNTIMTTAHDLLMNTVFYIMGITVLAGALGKIFIEFGVIRLFEIVLQPLMRPLYNLPGVAALGGLMTFFSDNPAIISLAYDKNFSKYFKRYQLIALTNFGTAFGMGLVVISFMAGKGFAKAAFLGLIGAIFGSIISTRLMQKNIRGLIEAEEAEKAKKSLATEKETDMEEVAPAISQEKDKKEEVESVFTRFLNAMLDGGKQGVELGMAIIPGVLIITTAVMILTFGPKNGVAYQGLPYEGVAFLPWIGNKLTWLFEPLFGFKHAELIAFPMTSLGAVGAALGLIDKFMVDNLITGNEIAVFTAIGMCWSGYLSTHTAMLDALGYRHLTSKAIVAHTFGGLGAGIFAHYLYVIFG